MYVPYYIQVNYAKIYGARLQRFTVTNHNPFSAGARCPICGDSQKSQTKTRFTFFTRGQDVGVYCHNCYYSTGLVRFIREHDEYLYRQLLTDTLRESGDGSDYRGIIKEKVKTTSEDWKKVLTLAPYSPKAAKYLDSRLIPKATWNRLFYTQNLKHSYVDICDSLGVEVDGTKKIPEIEGIFFPFINDGCLTFSNTRNLDSSSDLRYVTLEFQASQKIFGLETLKDGPVYVTEGPIDSLFLKNGVATGDASLGKVSAVIDKDRLVLVPDNEPRAPVQNKNIRKMIEQGFSVVLFPESIKEKDLNDMKKSGYDVQELVELNTYKGLSANLAFKKWSKL